MKIIKFNESISDKQNSKEFKLKYYAFDFDDNILHMPTVIHMDKKEGNEWIPIDLSTSDFAKYRGHHEEYRIRNNNPNEAFCEFRDFGPRGSTAFLEDCKTALNEGKFAPSWNTFLKCLSDGAIFSIITARGHEPESIKEAIEYIIDNILTKLPSQNPGRKLIDDLYHNAGKYMYYFDEMDVTVTDVKLKGQPSKDPIIKKYLNQCDFYGITSVFFSEKFGGGNLSFGTSNPEKAKEIALEAFVEKCNGFGKRLDMRLKNSSDMKLKSVSVGFSDDDPRNVAHVNKYFLEKPISGNEYKLKLNVYDTSDRGVEGGVRTRHYVKESNQSTGPSPITNSCISGMQSPAGLAIPDILKFSEFQKKLSNKIVEPTLKEVRKKKRKVVTESKKHPGFKKVASKIAKQQKLSIKKASAILAASTRKSSKKAKNKNPKLKKVK